jgi:hypothetical protein
LPASRSPWSRYSSRARRSLTCEYLTDPLGIDVAAPRLSWILNATSDGRRDLGQLHLEFAVPPNTTARIVLPTTSVADVTAEGRPLSDMGGLWTVSSAPDGVTLDVGSGEYAFRIAG